MPQQDAKKDIRLDHPGPGEPPKYYFDPVKKLYWTVGPDAITVQGINKWYWICYKSVYEEPENPEEPYLHSTRLSMSIPFEMPDDIYALLWEFITKKL